jgi:hypothetical protein
MAQRLRDGRCWGAWDTVKSHAAQRYSAKQAPGAGEDAKRRARKEDHVPPELTQRSRLIVY